MANDRRILAGFATALAATSLSACGALSDHDHNHDAGHDHGDEAFTAADAPLGVMTSLPLLWPLDAELGEIARGDAPMPWIGAQMEQRYNLVPLDTLSADSAASEGGAESEAASGAGTTLAELSNLAIIQPRALSAQDNVALDAWVRAGGRLLLVLDPALGGHYDLPLGDPRTPPATALIPPVVERWGLAVQYDDAKAAKAGSLAIPGGSIPLYLAGKIIAIEGSDDACEIDPSGVMARCKVGEGQVTLLADADVFEHGGEDEGDHEGHDHGTDDDGLDDHGHHEGHDHGAEASSSALFALLDYAFPAKEG